MKGELRPYKNFMFPVTASITFGQRTKKNFIFYFIEFDIFGTQSGHFRKECIHFALYFDKDPFLSNFWICIHGARANLTLNKIKKNRTRVSVFKFPSDGKQ